MRKLLLIGLAAFAIGCSQDSLEEEVTLQETQQQEDFTAKGSSTSRSYNVRAVGPTEITVNKKEKYTLEITNHINAAIWRTKRLSPNPSGWYYPYGGQQFIGTRGISHNRWHKRTVTHSHGLAGSVHEFQAVGLFGDIETFTITVRGDETRGEDVWRLGQDGWFYNDFHPEYSFKVRTWVNPSNGRTYWTYDMRGPNGNINVRRALANRASALYSAKQYVKQLDRG